MADGRHFENEYIAYLSEKSTDFHEILYTAADFELDERHMIKNEKVALDRLRVRQNIFTVVQTLIMLSVTTNYCDIYKSISACTFVAAFNRPKLYCIVL